MDIKILIELAIGEELPEGLEPSNKDIERLKKTFPNMNSLSFAVKAKEEEPKSKRFKHTIK